MKISIRIIVWSLVVFISLLIGGELGLVRMSRQPWFRDFILEQVQNTLKREVKIEKISVSFISLRLNGVEVAEEGGFENGTFLAVENASLRFSLWHLLHLHFKSKGVFLHQVTLNIIRDKEGQFNFATIGAETAETQAEESDGGGNSPLDLTVRDITVEDLNFTYLDKQDDFTFTVTNLSLTVHQFKLDEEFFLSVNTWLSYKDKEQVLDVPIGLTGNFYLGELDLSKAYAKNVHISLKHQKNLITVNGEAVNFENPVFTVAVSSDKLSSSVAEPFTQLPSFTIKKVSLSAAGELNTEKSELKISSATAQLPGVFSTVAGQWNYGKNTYQAKGKYSVNWPDVETWLPSEWKIYQGEGSVQGTVQAVGSKINATTVLSLPDTSLNASGFYNVADGAYNLRTDFQTDAQTLMKHLPKDWQKYNVTGQITGWLKADSSQAESTFTIKQGGFFHPRTGHFSAVSLHAAIRESMNFKTGSGSLSIKGILNQNPFEGNVSIGQQPDVIDVIVNAQSKRVALPPAPPDNLLQEPDFVADTTLEPVVKSQWNLPPVNLQTDIKIDSLDAPYLYATDVSFTSDLKGLTPYLEQTQGVLKLSLGKGTILDLYRLTNANPLTKVLFLSLNVVGKVFNSINVFGVLKGLKKGVASAVSKGKKSATTEERMVVQPMVDEDGNPVEMLVPYTETKVKGQQAYEKFETEVKFADGIASIRKGTFVSDMMSMRLDGTTNFNTGEIAMQVHAAPGKHEVNGVMPLTVTISGTVAEPKGKMSMLHSVTSLVTQGVTKNVVSRNVHKGVKSFFRLFKKKDSASDTDTPEENSVGEDSPEAEISAVEETAGSLAEKELKTDKMPL